MATSDVTTKPFQLGTTLIGVGIGAAILFTFAWAVSKGWATGK